MGLGMSEGPTYSSKYDKALPYFLAVYMGMPRPEELGNDTRLVKPFLCPAWSATILSDQTTTHDFSADSPPYASALVFALTRGTNGTDWQLPGYPFGKDGNSASLKMSAMMASANLCNIWAVADLDTNVADNPQGLSGNWQYIARTPVHGKVRGLVYFDFHAESMKVPKTPGEFMGN